MTRRILIVQGHPDGSGAHLCHALAKAYAEGARSAGHQVTTIDVAALDFDFLRSKAEWESGALPQSLSSAQAAIRDAQHLVIIFPLWLGDMPAMLKGFLEQVMRPGFAVPEGGARLFAHPLAGRSARVVITMGMPAAIYRWYFWAHALRLLKRNILGFVGIAPINEAIVGSVETMSQKRRALWLAKLRSWGREAS